MDTQSMKHLYPFTPRRIEVNGHHLAVVDEGQGPTVVLLHGNPTWSFLYRHLINALKDNYRVLAVDHLGCGNSDKPQEYPYRLVDHIDNLEGLLEQLDINRASLVMHDWGGAIGMGYATRHPERISALVLCNTAAFRSSKMPLRIRLCRIPFLGPLGVRGANLFARAALHMAVTRPMDPATRAGYLAPYDSWQHRVAIHRFVEDIPMDPAHPSWPTLLQIEQRLNQFRNTPVLLAWGAKDFCFTTDFLKKWQTLYPQAESVCYDDAGHYLFEDAHHRVEPRILEFLDQALTTVDQL
jgi:pimeloyl-ACP methyl ester carboxylesterase